MIELCKANECTGCSGCANVCPKQCIQMMEDNEGFLHPSINHDRCIECHACQRVCPELNPLEKHDLPVVYAAFNNNSKVRAESSSGGMFYALAKYVIENGGMVIGAMFGPNDFTLSHELTDSMSDVKKMMGSKYVQSHIPDNLYKEVLSVIKTGRNIIFTGTPCQVAACRKVIPAVYQDKILYVDIVCHGVPSQTLFNDYIKKLSKKVGMRIRTFNFRTREGWGVSPAFASEDNSWHYLSGIDNTYMSMFLQGYTFRENCYDCHYATPQRVSDITIADFWGLGKEIPYAYDKTLGVSLLLINTPKGTQMLDKIADTLTLDRRSLSEATKMNPNLHEASHRPRQRNNVYTYFFGHSLQETYTHYFDNPYRKFRRFIGKLVRLVRR